MADKKRLSDYPSYEDNPYSLDRDGFRMILSSKEKLVDKDTGEVYDDPNAYIPIDTKECIKVFKDALPHISNLSTRGHKVLWSMLNDVQRMEDEVYINAKSYANELGYSNTRDIYDGIRDLLDNDIISRKAQKDMYFINVRYLFSGNRAEYWNKKERER